MVIMGCGLHIFPLSISIDKLGNYRIRIGGEQRQYLVPEKDICQWAAREYVAGIFPREK